MTSAYPPSNQHYSSLPYDAEHGLSAKRSQSSDKLSWTKTEPEDDVDQDTTGNGNVPGTEVRKFYSYLAGASIVVRWTIYIVPLLALLWIPGILSVTSFPRANLWAVRLIWWSIWFTVLWAGWWASFATARIAPGIIRATVGLVAVSTRRYIDWMQALYRYIALFVWTLVIWVAYNPIINNNQQEGNKGQPAVSLIGKLLFGLFLCAAILLFEKFSIQWIAGKFHEKSYAERIADQKFAVKALVTLYKNSLDIADGNDTLVPASKNLFRKLKLGLRVASTTTATAFGNVASEIMGSSVLQPNSPEAMIKTILESPKKSILLAKRFFYSFAKEHAEFLTVEDIEPFFRTKDDALLVFALFDKDDNGDVTKHEMEIACQEFHKEQISIENSMRDLDSAVGRLDNIFMSVYFIIAALIVAVVMEAQLATIITGAGSLILGLSWLIGGSLQEVLSSIIFLFIKHPFDVGDRVILNKETYTVKEIHLLSTVFIDSNNGSVQAPNNQLNTLFILNMRRSPQMSETFTFDVSYSTTFEDLEKLRAKMLEFVTSERRDYQTVFDVKVQDFPEQTKMTLSTEIKYKSNSQQAALKAKRRNKWICALKTILAELNIYGPGGEPNPPPAVSRYTKVPWETIEADDNRRAREMVLQEGHGEQRSLTEGWDLSNKNLLVDNANTYYDSSNSRMANRQLSPQPNSRDSAIGPSIQQHGAPLEMTPRT